MLYQQRVNKGVGFLAQHAVRKLPSAMAWGVRILPKVLPRDFLQKTLLQRSLNYAFKQNIADGDLDFFCRKILLVVIPDIGVEFSLSFELAELLVLPAGTTPDVRFCASSYDLLLIATQKLDPDMLFFQRRLEMSGNTELGIGIKNLLASLDLTQQINPHLARTLLHFAAVVERYRG